MDDFARHILKGPNYIGPASQLQQYNMPAPPLHTMKLQDTSPVQACRVCRTQRRIVNQHSNGLMDFERCPACGGLGSYDIRKLEVRK